MKNIKRIVAFMLVFLLAAGLTTTNGTSGAKAAAKKLLVSGNKLTVTLGDKSQSVKKSLNVKLAKNVKGVISYQCKNKKVATVNPKTGTIIPKKAGTTKVTITLKDGKNILEKKVVTLTVKAAASGTPGNVTIKIAHVKKNGSPASGAINSSSYIAISIADKSGAIKDKSYKYEILDITEGSGESDDEDTDENAGGDVVCKGNFGSGSVIISAEDDLVGEASYRLVIKKDDKTIGTKDFEVISDGSSDDDDSDDDDSDGDDSDSDGDDSDDSDDE